MVREASALDEVIHGLGSGGEVRGGGSNVEEAVVAGSADQRGDASRKSLELLRRTTTDRETGGSNAPPEASDGGLDRHGATFAPRSVLAARLRTG
jgi:hypothetical protein